MVRRSISPLLAAGLIVLTLAVAAALAAEGDRDPRFGVDGRVLSDPSPIAERVADVATDSRERIIVIANGSIGSSSVTRALIARYNADGSLDKSFSGNGWDILPWSTEREIANGVTIDSEGRIVVGGAAEVGGGWDFAAARYLEDGTLDPSFGGVGMARVGGGYGRGVAVDAQGRVLLAGSAGGDLAVARITARGQPDESFGPNATREIVVPEQESSAASVQVDPGGRLVIGGTARKGDDSSFVVARLREDGGLDSTFGDRGLAMLDFGFLKARLEDLAIDPAGAIVVVGGASGRASSGPLYSVGLAGKLLAGGTPDPRFGTDGKVVDPLVSLSYFYRVTIDEEGRPVLAGRVWTGNFVSPGPMEGAIARLAETGKPDPTFGWGGYVRERFGADRAEGGGVAVDSRGRYVLGGSAQVENGGITIALARYRAAPAGQSPPPVYSRGCDGKPATQVGSSKADMLRGTKRADVIVGLGGDDRIVGLGGDDVICAGAGSDRVLGGKGRDRLFGGKGPDRLRGGGGGDLLVGGQGSDVLLGGPGRDVKRK